MNIAELKTRSQEQCELCTGTEGLSVYQVPPEGKNAADPEIYICQPCLRQVDKREPLDSDHWHCLTTSMWSEVPAVQVVAWRMLQRLRSESWAADNLEILYLDDALLAWAKSTGDHDSDGSVDLHQDCNGNYLREGDTVVLTKQLNVKGSSLNARMGTVVKNIHLVPNNTGQIEGRIEGQLIVILTKYVRKQGS